MDFNFLRFPCPVGCSGGLWMVITHILLNLSHIFKFQSLECPHSSLIQLFLGFPSGCIANQSVHYRYQGAFVTSSSRALIFVAHWAIWGGSLSAPMLLVSIVITLRIVPRMPSFSDPQPSSLGCQSSSVFPGTQNVPQLGCIPLRTGRRLCPVWYFVTWTQKLCFFRREPL